MSKEVVKLALAIVGVIMGWVMIVPLFEFPDEQVHLETVEYVARHGQIPPQKVKDVTIEMYKTQELLGTLRDSQGNNRYTYHPEHHVEYTGTLIGKYENEIKLLNTEDNRNTYVREEAARYPVAYYLYSSFWLKLVDQADLITRSYFVRFGSLPLAFLMAYFTYHIGFLLFCRSKLALTLTILTVFQPMFSFVTAGVNSDNLHNVLFTGLIYYCLKLIKSGISWGVLGSSLAIVFLDIYTKPQGYIAVPLIMLALMIGSFKRREWRLILGVVLAFIAILILSSNIWLNYFSLSNSRGATLPAFFDFSLNKLLTQNVVWYWGVFKWLGVVLPPIYWQVANRVVLVSAVGCLIYLWKVFKKKKLVADPYSIFFVLCSTIIYALAIYWADWQHHKSLGYSLGIQARYFFPVIVAQMSLLITGILSLGWSITSAKWLRRALVILFAWLQLGALWHVIRIYYSANTMSDLITQASQYKPDFAKGEWWYLWIAIYVVSLGYLLKTSLFQGKRE